MKLWWVEISEREPGQRKMRVRRYAVLAPDKDTAVVKAKEDARADNIEKVTVEEREDGCVYVGTVVV